MKILQLVKNVGDTKGILNSLGIYMPNIHRNPQIPQYYQIGIPVNNKLLGQDSFISDTGSYVAYSGKHTRLCNSVKIVKDPLRQKEIDWYNNKPLGIKSYRLLQDLAVYYLNTRDKLYVIDGFIGSSPEHRLKVRCICSRTYHALLMANSLFKPTLSQLQTEFQQGADLYIFNAGQFPANSFIQDVQSQAMAIHNFSQGKHFIFGTQYAGEMRRTIIDYVNYTMPRKGQLPLNASGIVDKNGKSAIIMGGPRTGKTTLCFDKYNFFGDGQLVWYDSGIYSIFGGCYPRLTNLVRQKQPYLNSCLKFGALIENALFFKTENQKINFFDKRISSNIRAMFPNTFANNYQPSGIAIHPSYIIMLTNDMTGTFPLISKLTYQQAAFHYSIGFTHRTIQDAGKIKQITIFPSCFDQNAHPIPTQVYVKLFLQKLNMHKPQVYMLNTGYYGGMFGDGSKVPIDLTQSLIRTIFNNQLSQFQKSQVLGFQIPKKAGDMKIPGRQAWASQTEYQQTINKIVSQLRETFQLRYGNSQVAFLFDHGPK